jgi:hypothetical protein
MAKKKIKTAETTHEFCERVEKGEVENNDEWYVRHPDNPALLKKVKDVDETCENGGKERRYSREEVDEFKKHFLGGEKIHKNKKVQPSETQGDIVWKK